MSRKKIEITPIRAERVKAIIEREKELRKKRGEKFSQTDFARLTHQSQQNVSRIIQLKQPLTTDNAQNIVKTFPEYRIEWLLGHDDFMTEKELIEASDAGARLNAPIKVLDTALKNVCFREGIPVPTLDRIPELILIESQLQDYAEMLMYNYLHREKSHVWNYIDQTFEKIEKKYHI